MEKMEKASEVGPPNIRHRGWKAMPFIICNETFEKLGTLGVSSNLMVYLSKVFRMKHVTAATLLTVWTGTTNLAPLVGAYLSDAYLGRYTTLGIASIASLLGMFLTTLTAAIPKLHPPHCGTAHSEVCEGPTAGQLAFLISGFGFLVVGAGGIRPCNLAFGADQFDPHTESGRSGINSFFNWYYFTFTFAMMVSLTLIVYVQDNMSWALGFGIPTVLMLFSCFFFFAGSRIYVKVKPEGSTFTSMAQVTVAASKKRGLTLPHNPETSLFNPPRTYATSLNARLPYTDQFRFLDKAAIKTPQDMTNEDGSPRDPWRLCRMQQVEELKCVVRVIPIWLTGIIFHVAIVQQSTYTIVQALKMDRHIGPRFQIPAGSFTVFSMLTLTLWIPIYDRLLVPLIRRMTGRVGGFTLLQRMGIGMILAILTMITSAVVEFRRRKLALAFGTSSLSALWLIPQFSLAGLAEAFNSIGQIEFYYKQFPENMRSVAGSLFFCGMAGANYLSTLMVAIIHGTTNWLSEDLNYGRLDYFYYTIAALGVLNLGYFLACARWYRYKGGAASATAIELKSSKRNPV